MEHCIAKGFVIGRARHGPLRRWRYRKRLNQEIQIVWLVFQSIFPEEILEVFHPSNLLVKGNHYFIRCSCILILIIPSWSLNHYLAIRANVYSRTSRCKLLLCTVLGNRSPIAISCLLVLLYNGCTLVESGLNLHS